MLFFLVIAAASAVGSIACFWLPEPEGAFHHELAVDDPGDVTVDLTAAAQPGPWEPAVAGSTT